MWLGGDEEKGCFVSVEGGTGPGVVHVAELHRVPMDLKESPSEGSLQPSSIQVFANTSTLHGIRHIFVYGPLTVRRVLWAVAFVGSLGLLLVESSERVTYYFSYQHVTKVDEVVAQSLVFPAVTLCNLNGFRFSRLTTNDLYHAGELLALLDVNLQIPDPHLADPAVLEALRQKANFRHYKPKQFSMLEFLHRVGHDLKDMMLYCKFKGQECGHQDFTTFILVLGPLEKRHADGLRLGSGSPCTLEQVRESTGSVEGQEGSWPELLEPVGEACLLGRSTAVWADVEGEQGALPRGIATPDVLSCPPPSWREEA
ncbi:hypothetical protein CB1_000848011 [Camelus ferus]|nr:hypothetical protein CB1_000848011 [Camelus ferus]